MRFDQRAKSLYLNERETDEPTVEVHIITTNH